MRSISPRLSLLDFSRHIQTGNSVIRGSNFDANLYPKWVNFRCNSTADGIRELRFSAVQGGAVRILFGQLPDGKQAILVGFVKKSDSEGYPKAIPTAKELLSEMMPHQIAR